MDFRRNLTAANAPGLDGNLVAVLGEGAKSEFCIVCRFSSL